MENLLDDDACKKVNCNPMNKMEKSISTALRNVKRKATSLLNNVCASLTPQTYRGRHRVTNWAKNWQHTYWAKNWPGSYHYWLVRVPSHVRNSADFVQ